MSTPKTISVNELVINYHVIEACNYRCQYCYAHWTKPSGKELYRDITHVKQLFTALSEYFEPGKLNNPLAKKMSWDGIRLNIAGGEPLLLGKRLWPLVDTARAAGMGVSLITNGSQLDTATIEFLAPRLSMLGISLDASDTVSNTKIGRENRLGQQLDYTALASLIKLTRMLNPSICIKINTVVNAANVDADLRPIYATLNPDRVKILQALPVVTDALQVSSSEFQRFHERHKEWVTAGCDEANADMRSSYIMLDPLGRFFQNQKGPENGYIYSDPVLQGGCDNAFRQIEFDPERFTRRYAATLEVA